MNDNNMNNMGDLLKIYAETSKEGKKLQALKEKIDKGKVILDGLDVKDTISDAKEKVKPLLVMMYTKHNLEKQYSYLEQKRTTVDVVTQAYYIILSKQDQYDKAFKALQDELQGE